MIAADDAVEASKIAVEVVASSEDEAVHSIESSGSVFQESM